MADPFRRFRVARKMPESAVITSFHLVPDDGGPLFAPRPGQYLTLRVPLPSGAVLRTYSVSNAVDAADHHRISVKRENLGSVWLHDQLAEGDAIEIAAPRGGFHLDEASDRPVLLLAGGVGQTPLVSMLHRIAATDRRAWFLQAAENGEVHALWPEVTALAAGSQGRITARSVYRAPTDADRAESRFDVEGVIDRALLQSLLPIDDYQAYLCGPTGFMVAMWRLLTSLGVSPDRIAYEFFGKGGSLAALAAEAPAAPRAAAPPANAPKALAGLEFLTDPDARAVPETAPLVTSAAGAAAAVPVAEEPGDDSVLFARSGVSAAWDGVSSILEMAEAAGLSPDFSCREGICSTCVTRLKDGSVEYRLDPLDPPLPGKALICCSRPVGRVVLDL